MLNLWKLFVILLWAALLMGVLAEGVEDEIDEEEEVDSSNDSENNVGEEGELSAEDLADVVGSAEQEDVEEDLNDLNLHDDIEDFHEPEVTDNAFVIVQQRSLKSKGTIGRNMTIVVDIINAGRSTAMGMRLQMPNLNFLEVELVEAPAEDLPNLSPGNRMNVTYVVKPKVGAQKLVVPEVHIRYALSEINTQKFQVSRSTLCEAYVASLTEMYKDYLLLAGRYMSLNIIKTPEDWLNSAVGGTILAALYFAYRAYTKFSTSLKQARRARAQKYLEELKDE